MPNSNLLITFLYLVESNRIRTVPEYGYSRYIRNHKSYKKVIKIHNYINILNKYFLIIKNSADISNKPILYYLLYFYF